MGKYFIIVDKATGEQTGVEGSGLYSVGNTIQTLTLIPFTPLVCSWN